MNLPRSRISKETYDLAARRSAHNRVIHHDDGFPCNNGAHGTQLEFYRCIALLLRWLNERSTDVAVLDEPLCKRNPSLVCKSRRRRGAGVRHGDDNIAAKARLAC